VNLVELIPGDDQTLSVIPLGNQLDPVVDVEALASFIPRFGIDASAHIDKAVVQMHTFVSVDSEDAAAGMYKMTVLAGLESHRSAPSIPSSSSLRRAGNWKTSEEGKATWKKNLIWTSGSNFRGMAGTLRAIRSAKASFTLI